MKLAPQTPPPPPAVAELADALKANAHGEWQLITPDEGETLKQARGLLRTAAKLAKVGVRFTADQKGREYVTTYKPRERKAPATAGPITPTAPAAVKAAPAKPAVKVG